MKQLIVLIAIMGSATFTSVSAQTATPRATKTQIKQKKKIKQGVKSGELTKRETKQLAKQQRHIANVKRDAKSDGKVTRKERAVIRNKQQNAAKNIYIQKHDRQKRGN